MSADRDLEIGPWRPGDEASICRLFRRTFGREKSVEQWRWQFLGQEIEPHVMVARAADGEVVAHFGGVPRRTLLRGREVMFTVAVDSMVAPERRRGLKRTGLFATVVNRWVERFCTDGPVEVGYGLANREALRIGRRRLGYTELAGATLLARPLPDAGAAVEADVVPTDRPPADHDALWERCAARLDVGAYRDARFMAWRYEACPTGGFEFLPVRRGEALVALGVFKAEYVVPDSATLVDLLWDGEDPADLGACVHLAEARAAAGGLHHLAALLPTPSSEAAVLRDLGYRPVEPGLTLVARSFRPSIVLAELEPAFYFTCGDFDLV